MRKTLQVEVEGQGVAALCVTRLLMDAGVRCTRAPSYRPTGTVLLSRQTQSLLRDLFPSTQQHLNDVFEGFTRIRRRIVLWGDAAQPIEVPHEGVAVAEGDLLQKLRARVEPDYAPAGEDKLVTDSLLQAPGNVQCHVRTSREPGSTVSVIETGGRTATACQARLRSNAAQDACWAESLDDGWLFLLSCGEGAASLLAVGAPVEDLLRHSRLVALQIQSTQESHASFPYQPRLSRRLSDGHLLRCGSAAMSFDPLCGEGVGNSVREAFLAAATLRAASAGLPWEDVVRHYEDRLQRGFLRHLDTCLQFYTTGGHGTFWREEVAALQLALQAVLELLAPEPRTQFRLIDRDLVLVSGVSSSADPVGKM
jgi:hypothetical protein